MKKEKYIVKQVKNGKTYLTVKFTYKVGSATKTYAKTFSVSEYPTQAQCMKAACRHRDIKRAELLTVGLPEDTAMHPRELLELSLEKDHLSLRTRERLLGVFDRHLAYLNDRSIQQIGSTDVEESMSKIRYTHSQNSINYVAIVWRKIFKMALRMHLITANPMDDVDVPKSKFVPEEKVSKETNDAEIDAVIDELAKRGRTESERYDNQILIGIILVTRYTGLRPSESFVLERSDIDFDSQTIRIKASYGSDERGKAIVAPKTKLSAREIPMSVSCAMIIRSIMAMSDNRYIFTMYDGELPNISRIAVRLCNINKKLGTNFHLYANRHQFASDLITGGVDPRTVMELMGHSSTDMTVGVYARSNEETKRSALVEIGRKDDRIVSIYTNNLN